MKLIPKPNEGEYAPYAIMYIDLLPDDGLVLQHLETYLQIVKETVRALPENKLSIPHAPGEWTVKDILVHIIDDERIYSYRALRFARGDTTELPGFDQLLFAANAGANDRTLEDILEEYIAVRAATITLFKNLPESAYERAGIANGHIMSVRAAIYHLAGHERHHLASIREHYGE
ncbi:MAG: DinB family protein [Anaerolineae bacterium]|nr:DinB family protein [Anaerolineae bacterium]